MSASPLSEESRARADFLAAAREGKTEALAKALAANPALASESDADGWSALMWAAAGGRAECVEVLLSYKAFAGSFRKSALMLAAENGHAECVELLIPSMSPRAVSAIDRKSALMYAAEKGHAACAKPLLPVSDPLATDLFGKSALMLAAWRGRSACVELLLPVGAPLARDKNGWSALMYAAHGDHEECVELLLPASDPFQMNSAGKTALDLAREFGSNQAALAIGRFLAKADAAELSEHVAAAMIARNLSPRAPAKSTRL